MTELLVPFRFGEDFDRDAAWSFVRSWYVQQHRGMLIHVGTCASGEEWSKGAAVHSAFMRSRGDVLIIADADVLVPPAALNACISALEWGAAWAQPHSTVFRLNQMATGKLYKTGSLPDVRAIGNGVARRHAAPPGGGIVVLTRGAYEAVGGIDPRFVGWGGDDISFARALDTLVGPRLCFDSAMWHLYHERMERRPGNRGSEENEKLAALYLDAAGNPERMRSLVARARA